MALFLITLLPHLLDFDVNLWTGITKPLAFPHIRVSTQVSYVRMNVPESTRKSYQNFNAIFQHTQERPSLLDEGPTQRITFAYSFLLLCLFLFPCGTLLVSPDLEGFRANGLDFVCSFPRGHVSPAERRGAAVPSSGVNIA